MTMLRKATRQKAKIRLGLSAVSGGGKTYSAILIAKGLAGGDLSKVAIIDTESGSADLYANMGDYNVLSLEAPFSPERYIAAIAECENAGMEVIIIDSITHEWDGKGGCLEIYDKLGGSYRDWSKVTPRHQAFVDAILRSKAHVITTVRRKQDYEMNKGTDGKIRVEKAGLKEVTREGFEYELTVNLELDLRHNARALKDRTGMFIDKPEFTPTEATGKMILAWCESGAEPVAAAQAPEIPSVDEVGDLPELKKLWDAFPDLHVSQEFKDAVNAKKAELAAKAEPAPDAAAAPKPAPAKPKPAPVAKEPQETGAF